MSKKTRSGSTPGAGEATVESLNARLTPQEYGSYVLSDRAFRRQALCQRMGVARREYAKHVAKLRATVLSEQDAQKIKSPGKRSKKTSKSSPNTQTRKAA